MHGGYHSSRGWIGGQASNLLCFKFVVMLVDDLGIKTVRYMNTAMLDN